MNSRFSTKLVLSLFFSLAFFNALSQKSYQKWKEQHLVGMTCGMSSTDARADAKHNVPLLEKYVKEHPDHYQPYYDLAMNYISLAEPADREECFNTSIAAFEKFIELAPKKRKYLGYKNSAVMKTYVNDCGGAVIDFYKYAEFFPPKHKESLDGSGLTAILKKCGYTTLADKNLIPNPTFEDVDRNKAYAPVLLIEPGWTTSINILNNWSHATKYGPTLCSSDSSECHSGVINLRMTTFSKHTKAMFKKEHREYIQSRLKGPLVKDSLYYFEMWVKKGDNFRYGSNGMGMALSVDSVYQDSEETYLLSLEPVVFSKEVIMDEENWTRISGVFRAKGDEQFIIIGNFLNNEDTKIRSSRKGMFAKATYFVDDIGLFPLFEKPYLPR